MSARILNAEGILSSDVPTGNLLWVDAVNGVDALATRGRMTIPFKTLSKAKDAAASGDTIIVMPGVYNENNLAKNGVNWHFLTGASIEYSGTGTALFDSGQSGAAGSFRITGDGVFKTTNGSATVSGFRVANSTDDVYLEFDRIETRGIAIDCVGTLRTVGNELKSTASDTVYFGGTAEKSLRVQKIESTAASALYFDGSSAACIIRVQSAYVASTASYALHFKGGTAYIDAIELSSTAATTVYYVSYGSHPLHLRVSRIVNTYNSTGARAVSIGDGSGTNNGSLRLYGCTLFSKYGDYSISSASARDVLCLQQCVIKKGANLVTAKINAFVDATSISGVTDL